MDTFAEEKAVVDTKERTIAIHLEKIDPVFVPFASRLAKPPYKDISTPEPFVRGKEILESKDLMVVHLTDTFPEGGIIHPTASHHPETLRFTVHSTINSLAPAINIYGWNWEKRQYGILIPFDKVTDKVLAFNPADTFFLEDLELPEGAVILKDKNNTTSLGSSGKAQVVEADYSHPGERLGGFHRSIYEQMINMGYFPQAVSEYGDWYSWGSYGLSDGTTLIGREVWEEFCKRNNLEYAKGNPHASHWTGKLEDFAYYLDYWRKEQDQQKLQSVIEGAKDFLATNEIPDKYKKALEELIQNI